MRAFSAARSFVWSRKTRTTPTMLPSSAADRRAAVGDRPLRAVAGDQHRVVRQAHDRALAEDPLHRVLDRRPRALVDDAEHLGQRPGRGVGLPPAGEGLGDRVQEVDAPGGVGGDDGVPDAVQRRAEGLQRFPPLALRAVEALERPLSPVLVQERRGQADEDEEEDRERRDAVGQRRHSGEDLVLVDLGHEEPGRVGHRLELRQDLDAAVVAALERPDGPAPGARGGQALFGHREAQVERGAGAEAQVVEEDDGVAFAAHQETLRGAPVDGPRLDHRVEGQARIDTEDEHGGRPPAGAAHGGDHVHAEFAAERSTMEVAKLRRAGDQGLPDRGALRGVEGRRARRDAGEEPAVGGKQEDRRVLGVPAEFQPFVDDSQQLGVVRVRQESPHGRAEERTVREEAGVFQPLAAPGGDRRHLHARDARQVLELLRAHGRGLTLEDEPAPHHEDCRDEHP